MKTIVIRGAGLGDDAFTTDPAVFGVRISWNATRIARDAAAGAFGAPEKVPMSLMPELPPAAVANIDWLKVFGQMAAHIDAPSTSPLTVPVLQVLVQLQEQLYRVPVDGNHRIMARRMLGMPYFESYVVPENLESRYRITEEIIDG